MLVHPGGLAEPHSLSYLAVRAWLAFLIQAVLDWLDRDAMVDRASLIEVCVGALHGATSVLADPRQNVGGNAGAVSARGRV